MKKKRLAEIDIVDVAKIAAAIQTPGLSANQKIIEAHELLRLASYWEDEASKEGIPASILSYCRQHGMKSDAVEHPLYDEVRSQFLKFDDEFNFLPMPYRRGLAAILPQVKSRNREGRFVRFLESENKGSKVEEYKKSGFPWSDFENCYVGYRLWWAKEKIGIKSKAGKAKKGKQGQVLRKNDGRKGARIENILKKIKKTT
jgi:hypothetical protein